MTSGVRVPRSLDSDAEHVWTLQQDEDDDEDEDWDDWDDDDEDWDDEDVDDLDVGGPRRPSEDDWN
jgi:hypothetical protein